MLNAVRMELHLALGIVDGSGNNIRGKRLLFYDHTPYAGLSYYRLSKQILMVHIPGHV
ncbi:MAG: hypothetical protein IPI23_16660 [Bacteroidetes bacterium]|nr:hypothetical protein [Bacteroidota bacterium]